ncbi:shikimate [Lepidopterella palustris CBS 459.81]|uniref:Shikimate n=1 Tax=Lepidopterella palustris CBS 459.81 TaxID=1314670 RepID=A0A8E2J874_9PEZI|nr:shikimate [Lepidopterella palustris CBS 459.81]
MTSTPSPAPSTTPTDHRKYLYLAGIGVAHSFAYALHNHIASTLSLPWEFLNRECPTVEAVVTLFRLPTFAGGVVTMPYKQSIMPHLDELDELALTLGACNNVYLTPEGRLRGTNTDWRGIKGCLLGASGAGRAKPAMIIGAGGASRAAVHALANELGCGPIYIINRDADEVAALLRDTQAHAKGGRPGPVLIHLHTVAQAKELPTPFYVVGTVPDVEPRTRQEIEARAMLAEFLRREGERGVLLDMCFKPRRTRVLKMGERAGWRTVEGTGVIGYQLEHQWRLWAGEKASGNVPYEEAWRLLRQIVEEHPAINFDGSSEL